MTVVDIPIPDAGGDTSRPLYEVVRYQTDTPLTKPLPYLQAVTAAQSLLPNNTTHEPHESPDLESQVKHFAARVRDLSLDDPAALDWKYTVRPVN